MSFDTNTPEGRRAHLQSFPYPPSLVALADRIDDARKLANLLDATAPQQGVYGDLSAALIKTLAVLTSPERAERLYQSILDGSTVAEALKETP